MPLSPPISNSGEMVQNGHPHLLHHDSRTSYPQGHHDEGVYLQSHYGSPTPGPDGYMHRSQQSRYTYQHQPHDSPLGIQYDGYHCDYDGSVYYDQYSTPATSPPTPSLNDTMRTRSGLGIPRGRQLLKSIPEGRSRQDKSPKPKKNKKEKTKAENRVAKLDKPLSVLTKDWKHVPVVDIEAYVNRSAEVRRKEVDEGKIPGKIKRPMNSFMLYRKAYQNRTKDWCLQNNHQVVSQVCGDSWPLEPGEIKDKFNEWARTERINHQNAHPGYKFSPSKPGTLKSTKRKVSEEPISEESDLDDFDWRGGSSRKAKKPRGAPRKVEKSQDPVQYPTTRSAYRYSSRENSLDHTNHSGDGYNRSSYQVNNPGKPLPLQYQNRLGSGEYYQQSVINTPSIAGSQDVFLKKTSAPGVHAYLGLPGNVGPEYAMLQYQRYDSSHPPDHKIDPSLMEQGHGLYSGSNYTDSHQNVLYFGENLPNSDQQWHGHYPMNGYARHDPAMPYLGGEPSLDNLEIHDPQMQVLKGQQEGWHVEPLEMGGEFEKWMGAD